MPEISLTAFLKEIDQNIAGTEPVIFSISFVKVGKNEKDKERGKIRFVEKASKGFVPAKTESKGTGKKQFYNVKKAGVLVLYDHDRKEKFSPIIDFITHYNGMKIIR